MADETEHTTDTAGVSSPSAHAPVGQPEDRSEETNGAVRNGATPSQEDVYGGMAPDEAHEATPQTPLIIGLTVAGLATVGAVAFFMSRRSRTVHAVQRETQHAWQRTMTGGRWWRRGMIWGGALGVVIGFLLAPKRGRELREDLSRQFEQMQPQMEKLYQQGKAQVDRFTQSRQE